MTGWHRKHAVRALRQNETVTADEAGAPRERRRAYGATIKDALTVLWEASDRVCGKRLKAMIPTVLPALERHGRLQLDTADPQKAADTPCAGSYEVAGRSLAMFRRPLDDKTLRGPDVLAAEAEAAIYRADQKRLEQRAIGIPVYDAPYR